MHKSMTAILIPVVDKCDVQNIQAATWIDQLICINCVRCYVYEVTEDHIITLATEVERAAQILIESDLDYPSKGFPSEQISWIQSIAFRGKLKLN